MDDLREHAHLVLAERHIAEAKTHIARQMEIIAELDRGGYETDLAVGMLRALERCLQGFERHRVLILKQLTNA